MTWFGVVSRGKDAHAQFGDFEPAALRASSFLAISVAD